MSGLSLPTGMLPLPAGGTGSGLVARRRPAGPGLGGRSLLRRGLHATSSVTVVALASALLSAAATGWLYWVRPLVAAWPGPALAALPLDELAGHDRLPLAVVLVALAVATLPAAALARSTGLDRLAAAAVLAASVGGFTWLQVAVSYLVVRQLPLHEVLAEAASAPVVYLAAAVGALTGAALGRRRDAGSLATTLAALAVAIAGAADLWAARGDPGWLGALSPSGLARLARPVDMAAGAVLLVLARGLSHRSRLACRICVAALGLALLDRLALFSSGHLQTLVLAAPTAVLVARRSCYDALPDPAATRQTLRRLPLLVLGCAAVAALGIALHEVRADAGLSPGASLGYGTWVHEALRALAGRAPALHAPGERAFFGWFPWTVAIAVAAAATLALAPLLSPGRARFAPHRGEADEALRLVRRYGADSLAPFALRADKALYFSPGGRPAGAHAVVAYRVVRGVALATGAPVGLPQARREAMADFRAFAHRRGWRVAVLGVAAEDLPAYKSLGLVGLYHGDEAVIDVERFGLQGGKMKAVRQAVHRAERGGYQCTVAWAGDIPPELRAEMRRVEAAWLAGARRKGFAMELDDLFRLDEGDAVFVLGWDRVGNLAGFAHLVACPAGATMSLSSMPRLAGAPNGFTSLLVVRAVEWCARNGFAALSLDFSPLAELLDARAAPTVLRRAERRAVLGLKSALSLQLDNLQMFNRQFCPEFRPRYVVLDRFTDLPRVVLAAMAAEGYLPGSDWLRGWAGGAPGGRPLAAERFDLAEIAAERFDLAEIAEIGSEELAGR